MKFKSGLSILISASMKVYPQLLQIASELEKKGFSVYLPEQSVGAGTAFKRRMIDNHMEKLRTVDVLLVANVGGRIGASTFFEAGWAFALGKPVAILEPIDMDSDYAEDLLAIGAIEFNSDLNNLIEEEV